MVLVLEAFCGGTPPLGVVRAGRKEGVAMRERSVRGGADGELRRVVLLEAVAAVAIFTMVVLVLYMIFVYKPV
jgi:hypothetical protein